jgi:hypothetical protein
MNDYKKSIFSISLAGYMCYNRCGALGQGLVAKTPEGIIK